MATFLSRRCAEGRLSVEELSARLDSVYRALTYGELEAVAADLPGERVERAPRRRLVPTAAAVSVLLVLSVTTYGLLEALAASPTAVIVLLCLLAVLAVVVVASMVSLALAAAPVVALAAGAAYLARWLGRQRGVIAAPPGRAPQ